VRTHAAEDKEKKGYLTGDTIATIGVILSVAMFFYVSLADMKADTAKSMAQLSADISKNQAQLSADISKSQALLSAEISTKVDQVLEADRAIQVGEAELRGANEALADIIKGRLVAPAADTAPAAANKNWAENSGDPSMVGLMASGASFTFD